MSLPRHLQLTLKSHAEKVCSLYKRALRNEWSKYDESWEYRYHAVLMRARFDKHKDEKDLRKAKAILEAAEKELEKDLHYQPRKFGFSPGGINYGREVTLSDWVLDYWHPLEKARYPEYFARREQRKQEFIERWEKKYGKPFDDHHH
ncbi:NADH dehydrogenase [ubiquinone] 1 beta subcomplex subunit 9 [Parasteatoda tepidariorum]|uniref:NADH dehydrogenase [ubiquinone] 1 beta subcomplex subunit 9 n=1 Tax=Parasteatoda tepidariorum TaxID=114398 RepID=A0A2L2Y2J3_PARTP|nr:NADH dehydrogenase [ubiquinone] 1 beta subcomplex subunit 9 [Parasteatoda tepidariorum]